MTWNLILKFFFVDYCCKGIVLDESKCCHSGIIERFEIFKMASNMAVTISPKTYMTNKLDKKHFNFDFLWMFQTLYVVTN